MITKVKSHSRTTKGKKNSVVRSHARKVAGSSPAKRRSAIQNADRASKKLPQVPRRTPNSPTPAGQKTASYKASEKFYTSQLGHLPGITKEEAVYHIKNKFGSAAAKEWSANSTRWK